jgi:hypothetical protein
MLTVWGLAVHSRDTSAESYFSWQAVLCLVVWYRLLLADKRHNPCHTLALVGYQERGRAAGQAVRRLQQVAASHLHLSDTTSHHGRGSD